MKGILAAFLSSYSLPTDGGLKAALSFLDKQGVSVPSETPAGDDDATLYGVLTAPDVCPSWLKRAQKAIPEAPSPATLPPPPHDGTGAPVDEPQPTPPPSELVKALPLDNRPTSDAEARRNRTESAAHAIADILTQLPPSERLEAVYQGGKLITDGKL